MSQALQCDDCPVRDSAACAALSQEQRSEFAKIGRHHNFAAGAKIFDAGDDNRQCATLISGLLKVTQRSADGTERIVSFIHPAGFVGELFAPSSHFEIAALTEAQLCLFGRSEYENALKLWPDMALSLLQRSVNETTVAREMAALLGRRNAKSRIAALLLIMADAAANRPCDRADIIDLPLTREEIAALLGLTIETISRQFGAMEKDGLILRETPRRIRLVDPQRLTELIE
ncbi:MAG: Crp/Fnr family transcriptional regulator [Parasphingorhabdus sp.]|nr:Crp/Fnr family transcriptional regulator [Parasphingorhabdus sp.]